MGGKERDYLLKMIWSILIISSYLCNLGSFLSTIRLKIKCGVKIFCLLSSDQRWTALEFNHASAPSSIPLRLVSNTFTSISLFTLQVHMTNSFTCVLQIQSGKLWWYSKDGIACIERISQERKITRPWQGANVATISACRISVTLGKLLSLRFLLHKMGLIKASIL